MSIADWFRHPPPELTLALCPAWNPSFPPGGLGALDAFLRGPGVWTRVLDLNLELFNRTRAQDQEPWNDDQSQAPSNNKLYKSNILAI